MRKTFNVSGICYPDEHYMVDLKGRLLQIEKLVDSGKYFAINRGRQYGKTTTLWALRKFLQKNYVVLSMDFQRISTASFRDEYVFCEAFADLLLEIIDYDERFLNGLYPEVRSSFEKMANGEGKNAGLRMLFKNLGLLCKASPKPVVLLLDEVDSASNNQVFLDFLSQLRAQYLSRKEYPAFWSVILAGVYDVKNLKQKIRSDEEHKYNSPWNIAADFDVDMSFSQQDIAGMLSEYEHEIHTGMNIKEISHFIYAYTGGYPYMVSRICQLIDEQLADEFGDKASVWGKEGVIEAVKRFLSMESTLLDDMAKKLVDFPELKRMLKDILFHGKSYAYERENPYINLGIMFGFLKNQNNTVVVANRIFEMKLYNIFLSEEETCHPERGLELVDKNQFIRDGRLDMELVLKKFAAHFAEIYEDCTEHFLEENGRRFFLLYLRPIINGVGNYYIKAQTRNRRRTDIIVDYRGEQFVVELKIWHGQEYQNRGKQQLFEYLEFYHQKKGYLLSFNFNKKKEVWAKTIVFQGKEIVEIVV